MEYLVEKYGDISVYWSLDLDGGGRSFGQWFIPIVRDMLGRQERIFEFCAGAGFIGFSLLAHGLCDTLCLADVNPAAIEAVQKTINENGLNERVTVYLSDCLRDIPDHERWDLVVGNPPHFRAKDDQPDSLDIIQYDRGWKIHEAFYQEVGKFLKPHGSVILLENYSGSNESTFEMSITRGGLELAKSFMYCEHEPRLDGHYFLWTRRIHADLADREMPVTDVRLVVSELRENPIARSFARFEKVRLEIVNDTGDNVQVGLQLHPYALDRIIAVAPGRINRTAVLMMPAGVLYMMDLTGRQHAHCTWC